MQSTPNKEPHPPLATVKIYEQKFLITQYVYLASSLIQPHLIYCHKFRLINSGAKWGFMLYIHIYITRKIVSKCITNRIVPDVNKLRKLAEIKVFFSLIMASSLIMYPNLKKLKLWKVKYGAARKENVHLK